MKMLRNSKETLTNVGLTSGGILLYCLALDLFLVGNNIAAGGIAGLATVLIKVIPISLGVMVYIMNAPILLTAIKVNGWKYTVATLIYATVYTIAIDLLAFLPTLTMDPLVASVFGGAVYGAGMALITLGGCSIGGTDLLCRLLLKAFPGMSIGRMSMIIDGTVVVLAMIVFGNIEVGLYAIITLFVCSVTADYILMGFDRGSICLVVSSLPAVEVSDPIIKEIGCSVTALNGTGMYTGNDRNVLLMAIRPSDLPKAKRVLREADPTAFVMLLPANEMIGGHMRHTWRGNRP